MQMIWSITKYINTAPLDIFTYSGADSTHQLRFWGSIKQEPLPAGVSFSAAPEGSPWPCSSRDGFIIQPGTDQPPRIGLSAKVCFHDPLSLVACWIYVLSLMYRYMKLKADFFFFFLLSLQLKPLKKKSYLTKDRWDATCPSGLE